MFSKLSSFGVAVLLVVSTAVAVLAQTPAPDPIQPQTQTPVTTVTQHPDGTYTIIEYPTGKEVKVTLNPVEGTGATGLATILRDDDGTRIQLNLSGLPEDLTAVNVYAVEPSGTMTLLGPVTLAKGMGTLTTTTPLSQFMIVASPETLSTYGHDTKVVLRSAVPTGFAVIPHTSQPVGERVAATTTPGTTAVGAYTVPMLNIPAYEKGDDTKIKVKFTGAMTGAKANVYITPQPEGPVEVQMKFDDLKNAPAGKVFTLWAVSPTQEFVRLGQVVNVEGRDEAEIKSETELKDFGLLLTMEDATADITTVLKPVGPTVGVIEIIR